ncbi:MAG: hypothetical protein M3Z32_02615 [Acidobacteriota bacterium]|nr:hypothetical protein [Acidobacteriota bacterium]
MQWRGLPAIVGLAVCSIFLQACNKPKLPVLEDLNTHQELSLFQVGSVQGTRDGDRLDAQAVITDSSSIITMEMHFGVGSPTVLQSGIWKWNRKNAPAGGGISGRAVTFLGGQDGPPSIGGTFDLMDQDGTARYRVRIPVTELKQRLRTQGDGLGSHPQAKP